MLKIYKSSAGSGKTYTLVKEYLLLVLKRPSDFKNILAITFTNKATAEMKSRIIDALIALSEGKAENLANDLQNDGLKVDIPVNAGKVLENILHDYSSFAIQTIDGFFQRIVRALAFELKLPLRFDIELNQENVINKITDSLLLEVGKSENITEWLSKLMFFRMDEDKGWNIDKEIHKIAKELFKEQLDKDKFMPDDALKTLADTLKQIKNDFEKTMKTYGEEALDFMETNGLTVGDFAHGKSGVAGYFIKILNPSKPTDYIPLNRVNEANGNPDKWSSKSSPLRNQILETVTVPNGLQQILTNAIAYHASNFERYVSALEVHKVIYIYGLLAHLSKQLVHFRDDNNAVFLTDTTRLLNTLVVESDTPFVYEKMGNRFKHLLIDEFQDTSDFQWKNLLPLVTNTLSYGNTAIVVGDAKQSIYRWRGGNMSLLLDGVADSLVAFQSDTKEYSLNTNYRSKDKVVQFNNRFFQNASIVLADFLNIDADDWYHKAYSIDDLHQLTSAKNLDGGYVRIQFLEAKMKDYDSEDSEEIKWREAALNHTLSTIRQLILDGYSLKDICFLVRRNTEGNNIAQFLFDNGFERVISSDSLLLNKAPQINFILNIYKYLNDRHDRIAAAYILYFYKIYLQEADCNLHELFSSINKDKQQFKDDLPEDFSRYLSNLTSLPLHEMTEQIIEIFGLNKKPDAYIQRFQDLILEYLEKNRADLQSFLNWWEENKESDKTSLVVPENEDAITIMTIHKAKGLQFPVVFMPFCEWDMKPKANNLIWVHADEEPFTQIESLPINISKSLENTFFKEYYSQENLKNYIDNLNLLYVAFTRPEDRLYIYCKQTKATDSISSTSQLINKVMSANQSDENWMFTPETNTYEKGDGNYTRPVGDKKQDHNMENVRLAKYPYSRWQSKISISPKAKSFWELFDNDTTNKINFGILVHRVMAGIITHHDIDKAISRVVMEGIIGQQEAETLKQNITELLNVEEVKPWFDGNWTVKTECEILLPNGSTLRPDRVLLKDKNAIIIDYKTGKHEPFHAQQVETYATVLKQIGYENIEKYLFYINDKQVVKL
ncbi:MAG: UvrD-helicase domain-containing protein [Bacteroidota bacterium]